MYPRTRRSSDVPLVVAVITCLLCAGAAHALSVDIVIPETDPADVYQHARTPFVAIARDEKGGDVSDLATFTWSFPDAKEPVGGNPAIYRFEKTGKFTVSVTATVAQDAGSDQISVNVIEFVGTKWNPTEDNFIFRARSGTHTFTSTVCDGVELLVVPNASNPPVGWNWVYAAFEEKMGDSWIPIYGWYPQFVNDPQFGWCWRVSTGWSTELEKNAEVEWRVILALDDWEEPPNSINVPVYESWTPDNTVVKRGGEMPAVILHHSTDESHEIEWDISHYASGPIDPTFTVTVSIYDLSGSLVTTLVRGEEEEDEVKVGEDSVDWEEDLPETDGIYTYVIEAEHSDDPAPAYPCADHDKSSLLTVTVHDFYWIARDAVSEKLAVAVRYELSRAALEDSVDIDFYDDELNLLGSLSCDDESVGTHLSPAVTLDVPFESGLPVTPIYCVVHAVETAADGLGHRDQVPKPALPKGSSTLTAYTAPQPVAIRFRDADSDAIPLAQPLLVTDRQIGADPEWEPLSSRDDPAAYPRGRNVTIEARFNGFPSFTYKVDATSGSPLGGLGSASVAMDANGASGWVEFTAQNDTGSDVDVFTQQWQWRYGITTPGTACGASSHTIYVTLGEPLETPVYDKLLEFSCAWAQGQTTASGTYAAMWDRLDDLNATNYTYYTQPWYSFPDRLYTKDLLLFGQGRCGAWMRFWKDMAGAHGIDNPWCIFEAGAGYETFHVKNYGASGAPAQGVADPAQKYFEDHGVNSYGGRYYDPSYGLDFDSQTALENGEIARFSERTMGASYPDHVDPADSWWDWQVNDTGAQELTWP